MIGPTRRISWGKTRHSPGGITLSTSLLQHIGSDAGQLDGCITFTYNITAWDALPSQIIIAFTRSDNNTCIIHKHAKKNIYIMKCCIQNVRGNASTLASINSILYLIFHTCNILNLHTITSPTLLFGKFWYIKNMGKYLNNKIWHYCCKSTTNKLISFSNVES